MRKLAVLTVLAALVAAFSGCAQIAMGRTEIDKLFIIRIFSIDEAEKGKVKLTVTTKNLSIGTGGGGGGEAVQKGESMEFEGDTLYDAYNKLILHLDRRPNAGHTEFILFGESIARKGVLPYLDFISRYAEFRYNAKLYIIKGDTASSFVKKANTSKFFVGDRIANIENNSRKASLSSMVTLNEALMIFDDRQLDTFIPLIEPVPTMTTGEEPGTYDILVSGYGIFRGDKLLYFTSQEEARGINWIMNRIGSGVIVVKDKTGQEISLVITQGSSKVKPRIEGNKLRCSVEVSFTTNIGEIMGGRSVLDRSSLDYLTEQQEKAIKREVEETIRMAQQRNSDHFSIFTKFKMKYPLMRDYFKENWKDLFPDIKFDVSVDSRINGTYMINEPTSASKEAVGE